MSLMFDVQRLRALAIAQTFFTPVTLPLAFDRLGFVQADPIAAPARAQDLILRHRVKGYRTGDLDRHYQRLGLDEGVLYAYGFMTREIWNLTHTRNPSRLNALERRVFERVRQEPEIHPRDLEAHLGAKRAMNAWGGYSKATTLALERLRHRGLIRVCRRESGIRIYEATPPPGDEPSNDERLRQLTIATVRLLAPISELSLQMALWPARRLWGNTRKAVLDLLRAGPLRKEIVESVPYILPVQVKPTVSVEPRVRFLAPFDPLVWDRRRFEHLWGWAYRFEAYTPSPKRIRGYYAMPLLWHDRVIGWVNAALRDGHLASKPAMLTGNLKKPLSRAHSTPK
jgi:hypothetical protein